MGPGARQSDLAWPFFSSHSGLLEILLGKIFYLV